MRRTTKLFLSNTADASMMMLQANIASQKSVAEYIDDKALISSLSFTAAGASDAVTWTGISIDREGFPTGSLPLSMDAVIAYDTTLGSGATLSFTWDIQDSADNSSFLDYATEAATVAATGPSGGGRVVGVARMATGSANKPTGTPGMSLAGARRYIRLLVVPDLSRTGTDTAVIQAVGVFGGFDLLAAPQT